MGTFDSGPDPRRGRRREASLPADLAGVLNRGTLPTGTIGEEHVPVRAVGLHQLHIGQSDFVSDSASHAYSVHAQDQPVIAGQWSKVGGDANFLTAYLGPISDPVQMTVWGRFSWKNDNLDIAGHCRAVIGLWADETTPYPDIWGDNITYHWLENDNHFYDFSIFGRFIVPVQTFADWRIGMLHQFNADGAHTHGAVRDIALMTLVSAYDPAADPGTAADPPTTV